MIDHPAFTVEPWSVREEHLHLDILAQTESVFALSNGHIGVRGNLDEGEPNGIPGTYLNSFFELRPLPYAEAGFGYPESGQTMINVTNGKLIRLLVDDEPFDVRYGTLRHHERVLDLRAGTLVRDVEWESPAGSAVHVASTRLVSFTHRAVMAILYEVEPVEGSLRVVLQSELVANEALPVFSADPRAAAALASPLDLEENITNDERAVMVHVTKASKLRIAAAMTHEVEGPDGTQMRGEGTGDVGRLTVAARLDPGQRLRLVKYVGYGWSSERTRPALHDQVVAALAGARLSGWDGLVSDQREFLDSYWAQAGVEVEGDAEVEQAVRFGMFHVLQAGARAEQRPIPAKGLTGPGYDGHTFWDTESFVLPVLTYTFPQGVADVLRWRASTLPMAIEHAKSLGLQGAAFAWRTIRGEECSGYWPAGTAAFHVNADIADAAVRYLEATQDADFERETALPILVGTARLWRSLGHHDMEGAFRIDGVTGPDEYSAIADNNVYTNLMAKQNLDVAADVCARHPDLAKEQRVTEEEMASWRDAAAAMVMPYDDRLGIHPQSEGFTDHAVWDFEATKPDSYPLLLHFPYFDLYRKQVVKQADLVLAMHVHTDAFTPDEKARNFNYYEAITVRDSSLSASTQAVMAAEVGHLELAHDYLGEAALMDLDDIEHNTRDGLHMAALAGSWIAVVAGFGGMRVRDGVLSFAPRLPPDITRLSFRVLYRGRGVQVTASGDNATYQLLDGEPLAVRHYETTLTLRKEGQSRPIPAVPVLSRPRQPAHRAPKPRHTRNHR